MLSDHGIIAEVNIGKGGDTASLLSHDDWYLTFD